MIVMKFGGSSVGNAEMIKKVAGIVKSQIRSDPIVVVSALSGATDSLIEIANSAASGKKPDGNVESLIKRHYDTISELGLDKGIIANELKELRALARMVNSANTLTPKMRDALISLGERMSARIVAAYMSRVGMRAKAYDAYDIGFVTDSNFGFADILPETYMNVKKRLSGIDGVPVITGFIAKDTKGEVTTLGRGGSDYTGSIVGASVNADEIQIWTNVNGIMTADPRIVRKARSIASMSYDEESELEYLGSPTLHLKGILPAVENNITVRIKNTMNPEHEGTTITGELNGKSRVASITHKERMCIIRVHNPMMAFGKDVPGTVSSILQKYGIPFDTIEVSRADIMILLNDMHNYRIAEAAAELRNLGKVAVIYNLAKVSIVGKDLASIPEIYERMLSAVKDMRIIASACGASPTSRSFIVKENQATKAVRMLHKEFFGA